MYLKHVDYIHRLSPPPRPAGSLPLLNNFRVSLLLLLSFHQDRPLTAVWVEGHLLEQGDLAVVITTEEGVPLPQQPFTAPNSSSGRAWASSTPFTS